MAQPETEVVETDVLVLGGGMAGCGAAFEAAYWAKSKGLRVVIVEKAAVERSGAVAMGLSAINLYLGMRWNQNTPEDFVHYVRQDLMGMSREDLVYDIARHVDSSVHMFEEWGLPIYKNPDGTYKREGRWQIMIHGESYKPIVAEAAKTAVGDGNVYERIFAARLLLDDKDPSRIAGAVGFSVRENKIYVFKAKAVIVTAGGATGVFRPHAHAEGLGRIWYAPWNTGSAYSLMIQAGATMTQMEHRLVVARFKDGYGPVGMWFLLFKAVLENAKGENIEQKWASLLKEWEPYGSGKPIPTPLRNHQMMADFRAGGAPFFLRTGSAAPPTSFPRARTSRGGWRARRRSPTSWTAAPPLASPRTMSKRSRPSSGSPSRTTRRAGPPRRRTRSIRTISSRRWRSTACRRSWTSTRRARVRSTSPPRGCSTRA